MRPDIKKLTEEIETRGFAIIHGFFDSKVVDEYQKECEEKFKTASRLEGKNYIKDVTPNYTQPWVIDHKRRRVASERLYEFYHNPLSSNTRFIIDEVIAVRDQIESKWPQIQDFNAQRKFRDYNIIARYASESGFQTKHSDLDPSIPFPTVQCEILLTYYNDDYTGGHLRLYGFDGSIVEIHKDISVGPGDLILFDKRLPHDVTETSPGTGQNRGRWMALIGAKTFPRTDSRPLRDLKKKAVRFAYLRLPFFYDVLQKVRKKSPQSEEQQMY